MSWIRRSSSSGFDSNSRGFFPILILRKRLKSVKQRPIHPSGHAAPAAGKRVFRFRERFLKSRPSSKSTSWTSPHFSLFFQSSTQNKVWIMSSIYSPLSKDVVSHLCDRRFSQRIICPSTSSPVTFADCGEESSQDIVLFCLPSGCSRWVGVGLDGICRKEKVRL